MSSNVAARVALAHHLREAEGLSIKQIADRLERSPATVKGYFYDPTGAKAKAVKARCVDVCRDSGAYTQPRNDKGDAYRSCKRCHPGAIKAALDARARARGDARRAGALRTAAPPRMTGRARTREGVEGWRFAG